MTRWTPLLLVASLATTFLGVGTTGIARAADDLAPLIEHTPTESAPAGKPLKLRAKVMSMSGADVKADVHVRPVGLSTFSAVPLEPIKGLAQVLQAEIPAALVEGEFDYFLEAWDAEGNGPGRVGSPEKPIHVRTSVGDAPAADVATPAPLAANALEPTAPAPAAPGLFARTPVWVWGLAAGAVLAAGGAVAFKMQANAIVDGNRTTLVDGVTHNSVTQVDAQKANSAATTSAVLGGVAVGLAGVGVGAILVEW